MMSIRHENIPIGLRELDQWVLWRLITRDGIETKLPFQCDGNSAKSNDKTTWDTFENVSEMPGFSGIGFVFSEDDPFVGIDLDGCRNPESGQVSEWAREVILRFNSYAEMSPSETGVKIFCRGKLPLASGRSVKLKDAPKVSIKEPAVELYDRLRYFAVTGRTLQGQAEIQERQEAIDWFVAKFFPEEPRAPVVDFHSNDAVCERARRYLAKLPAAISGQSGHNVTFHAACVLVLGFELSEQDAIGLMLDYNQRCQPPWSERDIIRKVREANKQGGPRGYLRNASPNNWGKITVPKYTARVAPEVRRMTLAEASRKYLDSVESGSANFISTSMADLDYSLAGGVEMGEMVIFAARPSHGKSAAALQCVHGWTGSDMPCCIVSEEMSSLMLGKRTVQYLTPMPSEHWRTNVNILRGEIDEYERSHASCYILEGCQRAEIAAEMIERCVEEDGVKCAVVDYAQLLQSAGKSRYEQITNTSIILRQVASRTKIVLLVLCQLNREIESRKPFIPVLSDLKDSGQLEQDADVVALMVWPYKIDQEEPMNKFQFYIGKNRNREINQHIVTCYFEPSRQMFRDTAPSEFEIPHGEIPT